MSLFGWATLFFGTLTLIAAAYLVWQRPADLRAERVVQLGAFSLSALSAYKLVALLGIGILPAATLGAAHVELLEGAKTVEACGGCHVMWPMVNDMRDPESDSLAARHFKTKHITEDQCYQCHSGYGLNGAIAAKLEGYRHLIRYTTGLYEEPIKMRGVFDSKSCLGCHAGTSEFESVNSHQVAMARLATGNLSCTNCHGPAHPTRSERTPGNTLYNQLMRDPE